jgi:hypothetical protein
MATFARSQRRLLGVGGTKVHLGSVLAVTYAGNAISVSLLLAGPELSTAFTFRQFSRHGIDPAVAAWALAVSGTLYNPRGYQGGYPADQDFGLVRCAPWDSNPEPAD